MATKIKKSEFAGAGMLIQLLGLGLCFVAFPFGLFIGVPLLIVGGVKANVLQCSDCRGKVEKQAVICPHCRAPLDGLPAPSKDALRDALR